MTRKTSFQGGFLAALSMTLLLAATPVRAEPCEGGADNDDLMILRLSKFGLNWIETRPICIDLSNAEEQTFTVRIAGRYKQVNRPVTIREKDTGPDHPTIRGESVGSSRTFTVTVREAANDSGMPSADDYEFWVEVPKLGKLDPMVRIIRQGGASRRLQYNDLLDALDDVGLDPDEAGRLLEDFKGESTTAD